MDALVARQPSRDQPRGPGRPSRGRRRASASTTGPAPRTRCTCARARRSLRCSATSTLVAPGLVPAPQWRPDPADDDPDGRRRLPRRSPAWGGGDEPRGRGGGRAVPTSGGRRRPVPRPPTRGSSPRVGPRRRGHQLRARWSRADAAGLPRSLAADLLAAFRHAETWTTEVPRRVGAALVAIHFTEVGSIERTLAVLGERARAGRRRAPSGRPRWLRCRARVAAGYAAGPAGPHPRRAGAHQRVGLRGAGRRRAGALGQRGPLPDGLRGGGDRDRDRRHSTAPFSRSTARCARCSAHRPRS